MRNEAIFGQLRSITGVGAGLAPALVNFATKAHQTRATARVAPTPVKPKKFKNWKRSHFCPAFPDWHD